MKSFLLDDENIVKDGLANLKKGLEAVGGKLYLTNKGRLIHVPHRMNVQRGTVEIQVSDVVEVRTGWTTIIGIPMVPNGLFVKTKENKTFKYVVYGNKSWVKAINSMRNKG